MTGVAEAIAQAVGLHKAGRLAEAEALYAAVLAAAPDEPNALNLLGVLRRQQGRDEEGLALLARAHVVHGDVPQILRNLAVAQHATGRLDEAARTWARLAELAPDDVDARLNLGAALAALGRADAALAAHEAAAALAPERAAPHYNVGNALVALGRDDEALAAFARAAAREPGWAAPHYNTGRVLHGRNRLTEAIAGYAAALVREPGHEGARWNHALAHLAAGDHAAGWRLHECRFAQGSYSVHLKQVAAAPWRGEADVRGRTILLHAEQGLGDTIQFVRFARDVAARGARVVLEVQPELVPLVAASGLAADVRPRGAALPALDFVCPLMSLPLALGLGAPPPAAPYLAAEPGRVADWRARLGADGRPRVGLVWSGNSNNANDSRRSIAAERVADLTGARPDLDWVALYPEAPRDLPPNVRPAPGALPDFAETAALVAALDHVVTVDTAAAHLAGALGRPVAILLPFAPDWRWGLARADTPWYPTARLFRQPAPGAWDAVLADVARALD